VVSNKSKRQKVDGQFGKLEAEVKSLYRISCFIPRSKIDSSSQFFFSVEKKMIVLNLQSEIATKMKN